MATDSPNTPPSSAARRLAIAGTLITGVAGIAMAVHSIIGGGEGMGAGALLAASALAFGLLAANVDRAFQAPERSGPFAEPASPASQSSAVADVHAAPPPGSRAAPTGLDMPTERELEVLALVADGNSNRQISEKLVISERTVVNHIAAVRTKLRAADRTHAVVVAVRQGWLDISEEHR